MKRSGVGLASALKKKLDYLATDNVVKIGVIENQEYENGMDVNSVAFFHEFGVPENNIPPRPFLRPTFKEKKKEWLMILRQILTHGMPADNALNAVGMRGAADVQEKIANIFDPPLKPKTIRARNRKYKSKSQAESSKPLVDSGLLISSISYVVEKP